MKQRLLTPGPTPVPEETLLELAKPMIFHRTAEFRALLAEVLTDLQKIFCTKNIIVPLTSSGTGALEAALTNTVPTRREIICLVAGKFGDAGRTSPRRSASKRSTSRFRSARRCSRSNWRKRSPIIPMPSPSARL